MLGFLNKLSSKYGKANTDFKLGKNYNNLVKLTTEGLHFLLEAPRQHMLEDMLETGQYFCPRVRDRKNVFKDVFLLLDTNRNRGV